MQINFSGKLYRAIAYHVRDSDHLVDMAGGGVAGQGAPPKLVGVPTVFLITYYGVVVRGLFNVTFDQLTDLVKVPCSRASAAEAQGIPPAQASATFAHVIVGPWGPDRPDRYRRRRRRQIHARRS